MNFSGSKKKIKNPYKIDDFREKMMFYDEKSRIKVFCRIKKHHKNG